VGLLLLVRHGQASFGADDYDVLSDVGAAQARRLGDHLGITGLAPTLVLSGGMRRQRETAELLVRAAGFRVPLETDERWDELDHLAVMAAYAAVPESAITEENRDRLDQGDLDRREFQQVFEKATGRWASGAHDLDYQETYGAFTDRVRDALAHAARQAGAGQVVVVVTSGGPIAAACSMLTDVADDPRKRSASWQRFNTVMVNASVTRVVVGSTGARLLTFNEHSWLASELVTYR